MVARPAPLGSLLPRELDYAASRGKKKTLGAQTDAAVAQYGLPAKGHGVDLHTYFIVPSGFPPRISGLRRLS
jgi:hypothetical protein